MEKSSWKNAARAVRRERYDSAEAVTADERIVRREKEVGNGTIRRCGWCVNVQETGFAQDTVRLQAYEIKKERRIYC